MNTEQVWTLRDLSRSTATDRVYVALVQALQRGEFLAGQRIVEADVSHRLGVSATPVREALRRLESDGVLVREPHSGMRVRSFSYEDARALYEARKALEGTLALLGAKRATAPDIERLERLIQRQAQAEASGDRHPAQLYNAQFHLALAASAQNPILERLLGQIWMLVPILRAFVWEQASTDTDNSVPDHHLILACFRQQNGEAARAVAEQHVEEAWIRCQLAIHPS